MKRAILEFMGVPNNVVNGCKWVVFPTRMCWRSPSKNDPSEAKGLNIKQHIKQTQAKLLETFEGSFYYNNWTTKLLACLTGDDFSHSADDGSVSTPF